MKSSDRFIISTIIHIKIIYTSLSPEQNFYSSNIKEDFETHQHSTREVVTSFVKNILKLNASGSQIEKFMSQLDVTDIIAIHRAMASGNFDKLSLGEKLQEYITPAQKDKEKELSLSIKSLF